jgi:nucleotide-binding universal stress UspA family protein
MTAAPVVVGVDGSEESRLALHWAFEYAQMSGAPVEAVIAWEIPPTYGLAPSYDDVDLEKMAQETLEETIRNVLGDNAPVTLRVERGHPAPVLITSSEHAQLLVVGSRGHGALADMLLGSVSQHCVHRAHCPVVVIRRPKGEPGPAADQRQNTCVTSR